jgi:hypothetical protein
MTLHAGSHEQFGGTLAAAMERAFAAEVIAAKGVPLPDAGAEDRHILFNAIAQGVLQYLRASEGDLRIRLTNAPSNLTAALEVQAPSLRASRAGGGLVSVSGDRWPSGTVTLVWEDTGVVAGTVDPGSGGAISRSVALPATAGSTVRLGARNQQGDALVVEV